MIISLWLEQKLFNSLIRCPFPGFISTLSLSNHVFPSEFFFFEVEEVRFILSDLLNFFEGYEVHLFCLTLFTVSATTSEKS